MYPLTRELHSIISMFTIYYASHFKIRVFDFLPLCGQYITGLVQSKKRKRKRKRKRMVECIPDAYW